MRKQALSFKNAFSGIWNTIKRESHMRFHMAAAFYVILFSFFYDFSAAQRAILLILIGLVMALECINTCIEQLCDFCADRYEPLIKRIKDISAGAVLIVSAAAAAVAVIFFFDIGTILNIYHFFIANPALLALLALSAVFAVVFVALGPVKIKSAVLRFVHTHKRTHK